MSQATAAIANMSRTLFRAAVNAIAQAIQSLNSGASAPSELYAYMPWADTTSGWAKTLNAGSSAWIKRYPLGTGAWVDVASAATVDLDANAANSDKLRITGTTGTSAITLADGQTRLLRAAAAWPITHGASLICPGSANYTCAAGDLILAIGEASSVVRLMIWKADGTPVVGSSLTTGTVIATTSGSSQGRTGISALAKQIDIPIAAVSTNGTAILQIQIGDSGGYEATGYAARCANSGGANTGSTTGFVITSTNFAAGSALSGLATLSLVDSATNTWAIAGTVMDPGNDVFTFSGSKSLSGTLDRVQLITTDTLDGGSFNTLVAV